MIIGRIRKNELLKGRKFEKYTKDSTTIPRQFIKMLHLKICVVVKYYSTNMFSYY